MAGYLGTKAVLLSTTAATVTGDMTVGGAATISGAFTSLGIDDNAAATAVTIDASGDVGIGTATPSAPVHVKAPDDLGNAVARFETNNATQGIEISYFHIEQTGGTNLQFHVGAAERMRIDSSGNLLVGQTNIADYTTTAGHSLRANGFGTHTSSGQAPLLINRLTSDGDIVLFRKDNTTVGSIGSAASGTRMYVAGNSTTTGVYFGSNQLDPMYNNALIDNAVDLGEASFRFDDIFATNGVIQTSDRNEKQDIDVLNAAETAVAQACKGLMRKFRWKDAVAEKGDDARIHFGIIAQDLQDAFTAQGLDAGRYAMFISGTWWEADRIIPAVEAVAEELDEDGNVIVEAVEAVAERTVTDTFETLEEAPEGATERTRLGVRYPELLAFIIGAM